MAWLTGPYNLSLSLSHLSLISLSHLSYARSRSLSQGVHPMHIDESMH